jgi:hypothetical protein
MGTYTKAATNHIKRNKLQQTACKTSEKQASYKVGWVGWQPIDHACFDDANTKRARETSINMHSMQNDTQNTHARMPMHQTQHLHMGWVWASGRFYVYGVQKELLQCNNMLH